MLFGNGPDDNHNSGTEMREESTSFRKPEVTKQSSHGLYPTLLMIDKTHGWIIKWIMDSMDNMDYMDYGSYG